VPRLFQLYREGKFPIDRLAKVYPAEQLDKAIADLKSGLVSVVKYEETSTY
jgi:Zn-dependent alcohol dehydrogenase